jgi:hypothetical protein
MLLIFTGSYDGTIDRIVHTAESKVFRLNLDLISEYKIRFDPDGWEISNPTGNSISSETASRAFWWKTFSYGLDIDSLFLEEVKYLFRELYAWFGHRNMIIGNPPETESRIGKLRQLEIAQQYFSISPTQLRMSCDFNVLPNIEYIVKSLTSGLTTSSKAMFTQSIDPRALHPNLLWLVQEKIDSDSDITVLIVGKSFFAFSRSRSDLVGLDWRAEQLTSDTPWVPFELRSTEVVLIENFLKHIGVEWGRIDFMRVGEILYFLEMNMNGQWAFLDLENQFGLVDEVTRFIERAPTHSQTVLRTDLPSEPHHSETNKF